MQILDALDQIYLTFLQLFDTYFSGIAIAIIILFVGLIIARIIDRVLRKVLDEVELNNLTKQASGRKVDLEALIAHTIATAIYVTTIFLTASQLGLLDALIITILTIAVVFTLICLGLALKDFIPNILAGQNIKRNNKIKPKSEIKVQGVKGVVQKLTSSYTVVRTKKGDTFFLANSQVLKGN